MKLRACEYEYAGVGPGVWSGGGGGGGGGEGFENAASWPVCCSQSM